MRETVAGRMSSDLIQNPQLADALTKQIDDLLQSVVDADSAAPPPPDKGLAQLVGDRPRGRRRARPDPRSRQGVVEYDETIVSERIIAVGDLYYIYQHEKIGVFRVDAEAPGAVPRRHRPALGRARAPMLSTSSTAARCSRYTTRDRIAAYRRILGYGRRRRSRPVRGPTPTSTTCSATSSTR